MANLTASVMSELTSKAFFECFSEDEYTANCLDVEGLFCIYVLNATRLEENRELVTALLAELPEEFSFDEGSSFLNVCLTKNGIQWTVSEYVCEQLTLMAIGLGLMEYVHPRSKWRRLPGGVPYLRIK